MTTAKKLSNMFSCATICFILWVVASYINVVSNNLAAEPVYWTLNFFNFFGG